MSGREPTFAEFEPTPLAPRRRRLDPVLVGALVVVLALGAAVVKPWDLAPTEDVATASAPPAAASAAVGAPATSVPITPIPSDGAWTPDGPVVGSPTITWSQAAAAITARDVWGVRAIVLDPAPATTDVPAGASAGLAERWMAADAPPDRPAPVELGSIDAGVLALGITFPPDDLPLDVRIWRATASGWRWLDVPRIGSSPAFGEHLFGPPRVDGVGLPSWPAGSYRVEVLTGTEVRAMDVGLANRFDVVPDPLDPPAITDQTLPSPFAPRLGALRGPGAFVVADGNAIALDARQEPGPRPGVELWRTGVAGAWEPRANGLGVLLPSGSSEASATLHRVLPDEGPVDARRAVGLRFEGDGRSPYVIFRAPGGVPWPAGVYRLDVTWTDASEPRSAAWHVELRPGPPALSATTLEAARVLCASPDTGPAVGFLPDAGAAHDLSCGEGDPVAIDEPPTIIGLRHAPGAPPASIAASLRLDGGRTVDQPVLVARDALPGLTVVAPANLDRFVTGVHRLVARQGGDVRTSTLCLGLTVLP